MNILTDVMDPVCTSTIVELARPVFAKTAPGTNKLHSRMLSFKIIAEYLTLAFRLVSPCTAIELRVQLSATGPVSSFFHFYFIISDASADDECH